jgi:hypothetical protein
VAAGGKKTVRFAQVVERAGEPHVHTLWLPPDKDPELKRAAAAHRVMTIEPGASGKTDVGVVGFDPQQRKTGQLLIFPKSLKRFEGARVVGIKFDLVEQPKLASASALKNVATSSPRTRRTGKHKTPPPKAEVVAPPEPEPPPEPTPPLEPEPEVEPTPEKVVPFRAKAPKVPRKAKSAAKDLGLVREVKAALKELERGKAVAAYQRLQRAIENR